MFAGTTCAWCQAPADRRVILAEGPRRHGQGPLQAGDGEVGAGVFGVREAASDAQRGTGGRVSWQAWVLIAWFAGNCLYKVYLGATGGSVEFTPAMAVSSPIEYAFLTYCVVSLA